MAVPFPIRRSCLPSWAARSCSFSPASRLCRHWPPEFARADTSGRQARTRPPGGHPAGERRTRRRRNGRVDPRPPSGAAPRRRSVPRRLAADRLRLAWRGGSMHWQIDCPAQVVASVEMAVHSVIGRCELEEAPIDLPVPAAVATHAARPGRDSFSSSRRHERLVRAAASGGRARQGRRRRTGSARIRLMPGAANDPDERGSGGRSAVPGLDDHRCAPLPRDGRCAAIETSASALDRSNDGMYSATIALEPPA